MIPKNREKPRHVDRVIVHQTDITNPAPGGIDTCIHGLCMYAPKDYQLAVVGVDAGYGSKKRLGQWLEINVGDRPVYFLPVARLNSADQNRLVPHSLRLVMGFVKYWLRIPSSDYIQAHRADVALALIALCKRDISYFIHTQDSGIVSGNSDSIWRKAGTIHRAIENAVITRARGIVVFNPQYANKVRESNRNTLASPTWYDPGTFYPRTKAERRDGKTIVWVGRLQRPKDPLLAVKTLEKLVEFEETAVTLRIFGTGSEETAIQSYLSSVRPIVANSVELCGRRNARNLADALRDADVFLMTSHPGYEGYPRVLVEALASGLPCVATRGADTGQLIDNGLNGYVVESRSPTDLAEAVLKSFELDPAKSVTSVADLAAPTVVQRILGLLPRKHLEATGPSKLISVDEDLRLNIDGQPVFGGDAAELLDEIADLVARQDRAHMVATPNVDHLVSLRRDGQLRALYSQASLRIIDGQPIAWVARMLGSAYCNRHTGTDLLETCVAQSAHRGWKVAILGGEPDVLHTAVAVLKARYPDANLVGIEWPAVSLERLEASEASLQVLDSIHPSITFVCLGFPKQELWIRENASRLPAGVYVGAGAAYEFAAGTKRRAPELVQRFGLEWIFRWAQEPRRLSKRYLVSDLMFVKVLAESIWMRMERSW